MQIEGTVRANLIAAIASARRWRGRPIHQDTADHCRRLLAYAERQPLGEAVSDLVADLEDEMLHIKVEQR